MLTIYLIIVIILFFLAISDLIVGVSNDAVNFLNSAVGSKTSSFKIILGVAALGILVGCTFSGGMMEVARKGIFNPEHFYFSEILLLFLAVMVTDIILLDSFNSFGLPTSTTVSVVFELLGAATAFTIIKIYTDPNALELSKYLNSGKALAIISGILLSVIVSFTAGVIFQYLTRLLFSFDYQKSFKYFGAIWSGFAIAAITYFMLVKGANGATFMTENMHSAISENSLMIIFGSFVFSTVVLTIITWTTKLNILKFIVLFGTFSLAMAFAGNDLVNFVGVPLAGYNAYELYIAGGGTGADTFAMAGLAGKVPTPTLLLLIAGIIMAVTLWTSAKARSVLKTSLDLGRQHDGYERFNSYAASRSLVRNFSKMAMFVNNSLPDNLKNSVTRRFDQRPFTAKQVSLGSEAPAFDMIRAATTLVVASILISIGTNFKLPLSTTYVTFMVFMGTSLADGAWGRESAVYRVSGVLSVVGGWFFTAFSAFTGAFLIANVFYFGGNIAILAVLLIAGFVIFRTHKYHGKRMAEEIEIQQSIVEGEVTKENLLGVSARGLENILGGLMNILDDTLDGLEKEDLPKLNATFRKFKELHLRSQRVRNLVNQVLDRIGDDEIEAAQFYILTVDYINEMALHARHIVKSSLDHIDNSHKSLLPVQMEELRLVHENLKNRVDATIKIFNKANGEKSLETLVQLRTYGKLLRNVRKNQIKRIKNQEIGTRNSQLFLAHLGEFRNLALFTIRLLKVYDELILEVEDDFDEDDLELSDSPDNTKIEDLFSLNDKDTNDKDTNDK